jgi:alkylated DNA repair dioxygenase AlkB
MENAPDARQFILKEQGMVWYQPGLFSQSEAATLFEALIQEIAWSSDTVKIYGRDIITRRKVAWYGDQAFDYRYSGHSRLALPWTKNLLEIKQRTEEECGTGFNSCLLNLYHDGSEGMGWHSDDEPSLEPHAPIASLSFGQPRRFLFRLRKDNSIKRELMLESGSLLMMDAESQHYWHHSLPVSKKISAPRINLTFRRMKEIAARLSEFSLD